MIKKFKPENKPLLVGKYPKKFGNDVVDLASYTDDENYRNIINQKIEQIKNENK